VITWGPAAIWAAVLFLLSSVSDAPGTDWLPIGDKIAHVALYGPLGAALAWSRWSGRSRSSHVLFLALGLLYGVTDEWHQSFVPGRTSSPADLAADALGVLLGYAALLVLMSRRSMARASLAPPSAPL
jgi:VanZ family protein